MNLNRSCQGTLLVQYFLSLCQIQKRISLVHPDIPCWRGLLIHQNRSPPGNANSTCRDFASDRWPTHLLDSRNMACCSMKFQDAMWSYAVSHDQAPLSFKRSLEPVSTEFKLSGKNAEPWMPPGSRSRGGVISLPSALPTSFKLKKSETSMPIGRWTFVCCCPAAILSMC